MVSLHRYKHNYRSCILFLFSLILFSKIVFGETISTGNILTNSTFGTGTTYSTTGWTVDEHTHGHHGTGSFSTVGGGNNPGGSVAAEENTSIKQTVTLSEKTNMTVQEMQNGWSSTLGADIWFWNQYNNTTTLKQTITGSDGSVSTQQRVIQDTGCGSINCGSFTNYTDTHVQGSNTQTDFDIEVSVTNTNNRTGHWGPDIDDVTLGINYTYINPLPEDTQDIVEDIDTDIVDIIDDIPEDFDWYNDDIVFEDTYTWEEEEYTWEEDFYFEEELETIDFDIVDFEELPMFEEFETFEEMPIIEEVFFEENYMLEPPPMEMMEEIFTEEFEEDFTDFLEETGMEEEFMEFLEDEGITAEEFFEEIAEEEFNDEPTTESFEEFEEPMEEVAANEESTPEVIENEEETMGEPIESNEPIEEETEIASNESTNEPTEEPQEESTEEEPDSEGTEESEVQPEDSEEQDDVQPEGREEVDTDDRIITDVAEVETKLKQNLKKIAKQIAKVTKETTQNLSKEDLFFKDNSLDAYKDIVFYSVKEIYDSTSMGLFLQIDLSSYSGEIYAGTSLSSYTDNDSIEIHRVKLLNINKKKRKLQAELEALKQ